MPQPSLFISRSLLAGISLAATLAYAAPAQPSSTGSTAPTSRYSHRLPKVDQNYLRLSTYVEDDPIPAYRWASDEAYEAFQDIKFGIRIHWGLYTLRQKAGESWPMITSDFAERQAWNDSYKNFNPVEFDADQWMSLFQDAGAKMFAITTKHHEGFSLFDTKTRVKQRVDWLAPGGPAIVPTDMAYSIMDTPFKRDIIKELADAGRRWGIKVDLYFSHSDWFDADFRPYGYHPIQVNREQGERLLLAKTPDEPTEYERTVQRQRPSVVIRPEPTEEEVTRMIQRHRTQLTELLTRYGKIDMVCLDIWLGPKVWPQLRETMLQLRSLQPDVMFRARGIGNYGDYYTPEKFIPGSKENSDVPWFVIYPLGASWSFMGDVSTLKGSEWIVRNVLDCSAKGGNFMVGVGPELDGSFNPIVSQRLRDAGRWLKANAEGIYATRPRAGLYWQEGEKIRFSRSKDDTVVYAFTFEWPANNQLLLKTVKPQPGSQIRLLGTRRPVTWSFKEGEGLTLTLTDELKQLADKNGNYAYGFRVEIDRTWTPPAITDIGKTVIESIHH
jgi:alpha-L-fucosidase